ncbi:hypothetical protein Pr1d_00290 [Bythopirellula goksoeyrii]|uniref:Uncharacterized protein n=1 Tax=Bythopirellula goksoeyrii TaxID=1400387 RepID=A0A5B9Q515_9BACT|nr:hypothetical protein Pr1d_00290 [Bythopirellula goksoeyrii]
MRDDIRETMNWKGRRPRTESRNQNRPPLSQHTKLRSVAPEKPSVDALDAAFEDVDLNSEYTLHKRVDRGSTNTDSKESIVERLSLQLSALEAQCHHLQGLLSSAGRTDS